MDILMGIWTWIANNILTQPAYFIGVIVVLGYALLKKPWYDILAGFIKAVIGYQILAVGSSGLTNAFRPILVGLQERFNMSAMVIDPYFGQNAVQAAMEDTSASALSFISGKSFSLVMFLLLFAFILNIVLVALKKFTKCRALFTTGHVQVQQASTAFFLILFCFPALKEQDWATLAIMTILLGSPVVVMAGFVPLFFDNATIGVYANHKGVLRACMLLPFLSGLLQLFGSAIIAGWVGMAAYGGYLGMWDWAVVWPIMTGVMKFLSYAGLAIVIVALIAIPQIQYLRHKQTYFMEVEDWEKCKEMRANGIK